MTAFSFSGDAIYVLAEAELKVVSSDQGNGGITLDLLIGWQHHTAHLTADQAQALAALLRQLDADGHAGPVQVWHDFDDDRAHIEAFGIEVEMTEMQAARLARDVESIAERDPYDPDRSEGLDLYQHGESLGVYPSGWDVAVRINGVEVIIDRLDSKEFVGELRGEDE